VLLGNKGEKRRGRQGVGHGTEVVSGKGEKDGLMGRRIHPKTQRKSKIYLDQGKVPALPPWKGKKGGLTLDFKADI